MKKIIPISIGVLLIVGVIIYIVSTNKSAPQKATNDNNIIADVTFNCDNNKSIHALFFNEKVELTLSDGRNMLIPQAISASGARYANQDESFVFWNKGDTAFIEENGTITFNNCSTANTNEQVQYDNTDYGFSVLLPNTWKGFSIVSDKWSGNYYDSYGAMIDRVEQGPLISIRHPEWTQENPRQDIPVMVFTSEQWDNMQADKFHIGAAPINPRELAKNDKYIFALPARYNYSYLTGYEEVDNIINNNAVVDTSWLNIKSAIENCNVKDIMQAHSLLVSATLKDGTKITGYEPKIDDIMDVVNTSKDKCGDITIATE